MEITWSMVATFSTILIALAGFAGSRPSKGDVNRMEDKLIKAVEKMEASNKESVNEMKKEIKTLNKRIEWMMSRIER